MALIDPQTILDDIVRGRVFLTNLVHNEIYADQIATNRNKCEVEAKRLLFIIRALEFRTEQDKYDEITQSLWRCLIKIIGTYVAPTKVRFYYGIKSTTTNLTEEQILASSYIEYVTNTNPIITFPYSVNPNYYWMAEYVAQPLKIKWQDTIVSINKGDIGTIQDTFGPVVNIGAFRFYDTQFATQFLYPIQFKVS